MLTIWKTTKMKIPLSLIKWPRLNGVEEKKPDERLLKEIKIIGNRKNTTNIITNIITNYLISSRFVYIDPSNLARHS